jgi:Leucine-rich repeat (LRR) protein
MYGCRFRELPPEIGKLAALETLDLRCNSLVVDNFPTTFTGLVKLEKLFLSENSLAHIPKEVSLIFFQHA